MPSKPTPLRALSLHQPFAWAIAAGIKTIENRNWTTNYRGLVAVHAGSNRKRVDQFSAKRNPKLPTNLFTFSAIIGVAELVDVVEMNEELESDPFAVGEQCWMFEKARLLSEPIPCEGKLRLFPLDHEVETRVRGQLQDLTPRQPDSTTEEWAALLRGDTAGLHRFRGGVYTTLGRGDDAIRNFDRAIEREPRDPVLYYCRALVWTWINENAFRGIADCTKVIEMDPKHVDAYLLRSEAHRSLGDDASADADERRAEQLEPGCVQRWKEENEQGDSE